MLDGGVWGYLSTDANASRVFDDAMTGKAHGQIAGVIAVHDFSATPTIADIGGGRGHLLRAILDKAPSAKGVLFDQPHVVDQAEASERMTRQGGDFFKDTLPACDLYLLMEVIHDWDDDHARQILSRIRASASPGARVLLIEALIPESDEPSLPADPRPLDADDQRQAADARGICRAARPLRVQIHEVVDTGAGVSIVEGTA